MIKDKLISKTIYFSLVVQFITTIVGLHGFFLNVKEKDIILQDILGLETVVQIVEATFKEADVAIPGNHSSPCDTTIHIYICVCVYMFVRGVPCVDLCP